jgi:HPt (histidine-containing phosphotransfer) domain-containing protein
VPDSPVIDTRAIERLRKWGGENLPRRMVEIFLEHAPERLQQIRGGLEEGDGRRVETGTHSLKSSAGNVGAVRLQALCQAAEMLAEAGDLSGVQDLFPELEHALEETKEELAKILEGMGE